MEKLEDYGTSIAWEGTHTFFISGTKHQDDSLLIVSKPMETKQLLTLTLPTLCITYADMAFANATGGIQDDYPESQAYGAVHFDPPINLVGEHEIRKFTWIRGAKQVAIGPEETVIKWDPRQKLVIPKLRISPKQPVKTLLHVPEVFISVSQPVEVQVMQFANGRHIGGVQMSKNHPDWKPDDKNQFDLKVQVVDQKEEKPIAEARVTLLSWNEEKNDYVLDKESFTDKNGIVRAPEMECQRMMLSVEKKPYDSQEWEFRPFDGQEIKRVFFLN